MKKLSYIFIISLGIFAITSCDIDKSPYDSITSDDLAQSETSAMNVTLGTYSRMKAWTENWHRLFEYPGDNVALSGTTSDPLFFTYNYQRIPNGSRAAGFWRSSYQIAVSANQVIGNVVEGSSESNDQILAENYYIRALMHFTMVNIFGRPYNQGVNNPGVPLKLDAEPLNHPTRSSVGEVYDQVEADLLKAAALFTESKSNVFASKEAAWALLSRLYLYKEDNQKAIEYADLVLNSGRFSLVPTQTLGDYPKLSPESNTETIFAVKFVRDVDYESNGWYTIGSLYANLQGAGWGELYASRPYLELVREFPEDQRNNFILPFVVNEDITWGFYVRDNLNYGWTPLTPVGDGFEYTHNGTTKTVETSLNERGGISYYMDTDEGRKRILIDKQLDLRNNFPKYFITKCSGQDDQAHLWSPVVSRLAEMYLNKAEAAAKLGQNAEALELVNVIRSRAGIPANGLYTMANLGGKSVMDVVMEERMLELAWEGHRKMDVFRNGKTMDRRYPGTHLVGNNPKTMIQPNDNAIIEFIPEAQLLVHEGLTQNPS
ncbi:RagB/SusD family nutrient uptake outer membrane protein [Belliella sp. DSM 107340]|uniref:RagB/SusD family nutrient uptake outer membrane protein n=1 Tax=Belliella calami TaxID=2923436 RepID=A0ABS9UTT0_9BACT|nr:RagB/SusD family nutrient uptake outer membrane protein [Belliella calami]MCH7399913.1 RagB/SusD family nutrient uptake outer membrane protein [Belliella calami]